jgi:hypothetical protein
MVIKGCMLHAYIHHAYQKEKEKTDGYNYPHELQSQTRKNSFGEKSGQIKRQPPWC